MKFSQRIGVTPVSKPIQLNHIDQELKNGLWNILDAYIFSNIKDEHSYMHNMNLAKYFANSLWHNFFKNPIDSVPSYFPDTISQIRRWFFNAEWHEVYDFIEYVVGLISDKRFDLDISTIKNSFNNILEREFSGYRFIKGHLSPITNKSEIDNLEFAIKQTESFSPLKGCNFHLQSALEKLSDKKNPDYRNSIKESILAVESIVKSISNNAKDSLGGALDKIKGKIKLHPALEKGLKQIYGYTSDDSGIRHALMDEPSCDFDDAKFMLISCSAFINYLIAKSERVGIKF
ncbi:MAG TPA: hypothetical protein VHD35_10960 [Chitinophagaceae bacterium]|nr:hypothetical protein [Chitinophagaceae bacterium]